jgi:hypothetical protein
MNVCGMMASEGYTTYILAITMSAVLQEDRTGTGGWHKLELDSTSVLPTPRGWFAACATVQGLLVHGGNSPSNERLNDMYLLDLHSG